MSQDTYMMPRNNKESERLNQQGQFLEMALGYMIHPDPAATLPANPMVADIGTGTGDFLIRLCKDHPPESGFHGFDLSPDQFAPRSDLPGNVHLHVQDVKGRFPTEFHHKFDVVHLRLLVLGLDKDDWAIATQNAIELLRPGGWIQWLEHDLTTVRTLRGGPAGSTNENLRFAVSAFTPATQNPRIQYGFNTLPDIFRTAGLEKVSQDVVAMDRIVDNRKNLTLNGLEGAMSWVRKTLGAEAVKIYQGKSVDEVERKAREDIENGAYSRYDLYCTVGRKPIEST